MFDPGPSIFDTGRSFTGGMFSFVTTAIPVLIVAIFAIVIFGLIQSGIRYARNARSPRESLFARIVSKRMDVRNYSHHHNHGDGMMHTRRSSRTHYYITLEFDDGSRKEYLDVKKLSGLVAEGDSGYASVQGDWIVAFERNVG